MRRARLTASPLRLGCQEPARRGPSPPPRREPDSEGPSARRVFGQYATKGAFRSGPSGTVWHLLPVSTPVRILKFEGAPGPRILPFKLLLLKVTVTARVTRTAGPDLGNGRGSVPGGSSGQVVFSSVMLVGRHRLLSRNATGSSSMITTT